MEGNLLKTRKINCCSKSGLLAKTLNKASLSTSKTEFAIDIQELLKDKKYVVVSYRHIYKQFKVIGRV
jgi:2-phosphoglycerate kinase